MRRRLQPQPAALVRSLPLGIFALAFSLLSAESVEVGSQPSVTNSAGAGNSFVSTVSRNGKIVVFSSEANNLVPNDDTTPFLDLFARDLQSGTTMMLSQSMSGLGGGNGNSVAPSISSNGNWVALESAASNLVVDDNNGGPDVFVRDIAGGTTELVSRNFEGTGSGNGKSRAPHISSNGRYVLFESSASNLVTNDFNSTNDVFVRDLQAGTTRLVSVNSAGVSGNGSSESASVTPDGRYVVFVSSASDLVNGASNTFGHIFVRDLTQEQTIWASSATPGFFGNARYSCFNPVISTDGQVVAFKVLRIDVSPAEISVFRVNLASGATTILSASERTTFPSISSDGRYVAYESGNDVLILDAASQATAIASIDLSGNAGTGSAHTPTLTPDGRWIVFLSDSGSLVTNAVPGGVTQLYLRDLMAQKTTLISRTMDGIGAASDLATVLPAMSADATVIAFDSSDPRFVPNDLNVANDVFVWKNGTIELISHVADALPARTGASMTFVNPGCLSTNGDLLVFSTMDSSLDSRDTNQFPDVFVFDRSARSTRAVSLFPQNGQDGSNGAVITNTVMFRTNFVAEQAVISGNGRYVAFVWEQARWRNPVGRYIYLRDLETDTTRLISREVQGNFTYPTSEAPAVDAAGSLVAFESNSQYLLDYGSWSFFGKRHVFLYRSRTNYLVSINRNGNSNANDDSIHPILTPDNRWVVFYSTATDLTTNSLTGYAFRIFAHDLTISQTRLLSVDQNGVPLSETCTGAVVSANSRFVTFHTTTSQSIYRFDLSLQTNRLVCTNCSYPSINRDGRLIAYQSRDQSSGVDQIFVTDLENNTTTLVSVDGGGSGGGNGHSRWAQIGADGRYLVFSSEASDLVDNDFNNAPDIFVRDLGAGTTMLLSINAQGTASGNKRSSKAFLSPDGRTVAFQSFASDLVAADYNNARDIFVVRLAAPDSDNDQLDDDWELAYFNTLSRDGSDDYDHDGRTDRQEFLSGTDPTNDGSVLRVLTLSRVSGGALTLLWSAVPGKRYNVQYKETVHDPQWHVLASGIRASSSTASTNDNSNNANRRFYRVVVLQ